MIADFGEIQPFFNIRAAEARHIEALTTLFTKYRLAIPANTWQGKIERYVSVQAACEAAVTAEIANGEMYDRLLAQTSRPEIVVVLRNLQAVSEERHLPAFQRCLQHESGEGKGYRGIRRHRSGRMGRA